MPTTTNYIWDEDNLLAEADGTNAINTVYTNEPQEHGNLVSTRIGSTTSYHHFDALGSTRQLTNAVGHVTDSMNYDAWGNVTARTGTTNVAFIWAGEIGYYYDRESGTFWIAVRPYGLVIGRWLSNDPAGYVDGPNRYLYVRNNPISRRDPSGLSETYLSTQIDPTKCEVNLNVQVCLKFGPGWTYEQITYWYRQFAQQIEKAWSPTTVVITSANKCGPCPSGWHPKLRLQIGCVPGAYPINVGAADVGSQIGTEHGDLDWHDIFETYTVFERETDGRVKVTTMRGNHIVGKVEYIPPGEANDPHIPKGTLPDVPGQTTKYCQTTVVHEAGHLIGLTHPGVAAGVTVGGNEVRNSWPTYLIDAASTMGLGTELRAGYFNPLAEALNGKYGGCCDFKPSVGAAN